MSELPTIYYCTIHKELARVPEVCDSLEPALGGRRCEVIEYLLVPKDRVRQVDLLFQGEGPHLEFVEAESPEDQGIRVGEWLRRGEFHVLRVLIVEDDDGT